jgi:hypothetical protein
LLDAALGVVAGAVALIGMLAFGTLRKRMGKGEMA